MRRRERPAQTFGIARHDDQMHMVRQQHIGPDLDPGRPPLYVNAVFLRRISSVFVIDSDTNYDVLQGARVMRKLELSIPSVDSCDTNISKCTRGREFIVILARSSIYKAFANISELIEGCVCSPHLIADAFAFETRDRPITRNDYLV
jgi:hypothetical protein